LKDAGDMGSGHAVTALFELAPRSVDVGTSTLDALKYQTADERPAPRPASK